MKGARLGERFAPLFKAIDEGRIQGVVTPITIAEVVTGPLRSGNEGLAERYRSALTLGAGWSVRDIDTDTAVLAARLRLRHKLKLPDALQLAATIRGGCYALVSHDRDFAGVADIPVLGL